MAVSKQALPLFRVYYRYTDGDTTRPRGYSITINATDAAAAEAAVRARMVADGMPMNKIEITGASLNALT